MLSEFEEFVICGCGDWETLQNMVAEEMKREREYNLAHPKMITGKERRERFRESQMRKFKEERERANK